MRQHPADRRGVDRAHVDGRHLDRVPPRRAGLPHPVRGVIGGAALDLAQQPMVAGQVKEAGMPAVGQQHVLPAARIDGEPGPAAAVLIDAQVHHRGRRLAQHRFRLIDERPVRGRPGHLLAPARLGHRAAPPGYLRARQLPQPRREPAPPRNLGQGLGERPAPALAVAALPASLQPARRHLVQAPPQVTRAGQHVLVHSPRERPAVRARSSARMIGGHPDGEAAISLRVGLHDPQAVHAEQRGGPILDHGARGSLTITVSFRRSMISGTAGLLITTARRSPPPGQPRPSVPRATHV